MMFYALVTPTKPTLSTVAGSRAEALAQFSKEFGYELSEDPNGHMTDHMLDEWTENPHWLNPTIGIFKQR